MLKKGLIGCSALVGVGIVIISILVALNWEDWSTRATNIMLVFSESDYADATTVEQFQSYPLDYAEEIALVTYYVNEDGSINNGKPTIWHQADEAMPLASTIKIVILAGYADAVVNGRLDPTENISLTDWEAFYLPHTDGGAHPSALQELNIETTESGTAVDPTQTVPLDQIARAMIRYSDNAATDYLVNRIGQEQIAQLVEEAGLTGQSSYLSLVGMFLTWHNHEQSTLSEAHVAQLETMGDDEYAQLVAEYAHKYSTDANWREAEQAWRQSAPMSNISLEAQVVHALAPTGTARDYATIMAGVVTETFISPEVSQLMQTHLQWPMEFPSNQARLETLGTKGGSLAKMLTEASYYQVTEDGDPMVVVLFMRQIPVGGWAAMMQNPIHQLFMYELATEPEFLATIQTELEKIE